MENCWLTTHWIHCQPENQMDMLRQWGNNSSSERNQEAVRSDKAQLLASAAYKSWEWSLGRVSASDSESEAEQWVHEREGRDDDSLSLSLSLYFGKYYFCYFYFYRQISFTCIFVFLCLYLYEIRFLYPSMFFIRGVVLYDWAPHPIQRWSTCVDIEAEKMHIQKTFLLYVSLCICRNFVSAHNISRT